MVKILKFLTNKLAYSMNIGAMASEILYAIPSWPCLMWRRLYNLVRFGKNRCYHTSVLESFISNKKYYRCNLSSRKSGTNFITIDTQPIDANAMHLLSFAQVTIVQVSTPTPRLPIQSQIPTLYSPLRDVRPQ